MTARDAQIMQTTGNLHHQIRHAILGQAQHIFHNPTPFDPSDGVFDYYSRTGVDLIQEMIAHAQVFAFRLFLGWRVRTPSGS